MAEDGRLARVARAPADEPGLSDLLDPVALEERLREARLRRAEALARRPAPPPEATAPPAPPPAPPPTPVAAEPITLTAPPRAVPAPARLRTGAALPLLIFLAGLGLGGAAVAVLALRALPERIGPSAEVAPAPAPSARRSVAPLPDAPDAAPEAPAPVVAAAPSPPPAPADSVAPEAPRPAAAAPDLPDPARLAAPAAEETPPATAGAPAETALAAAPAAALALPARVLVHYPASAAESATEARDALRAAGVPEVEIIPARYAIGRSNIRYYHAGDREPAAALAPLVAPALDGDAPEARDFTDYPTPAAAGTVEIWLAGAPDAGAPRTASRTAARSAPATPLRGTPATAAPAPYQIPGVIAPAPTRAEQVERILLERLRQGG